MDIFLKRFDQVVLTCLFGLVLLIALLWGFGDRTPTTVETFSWEGKQISVADQTFQLTFNEAVDPAFVAQHLTLDPPLPGKLSWIGKRFFYTLKDLPIYGQDYQLQLSAPEVNENTQPVIEPFLSRFKTRDRAFAYIGTEGTDRGRLILYNLTQQAKSVLTPADLIVLDFDVYPDGDRLLFAAIPRGANNIQVGDQKLYTITTGLNFKPAHTTAPPAGQIRQILDATDYQNGKFQLAANGQRIIIQRTNRENPRDRSLWAIEGQAEPRPLGVPADDFLLAPNAAVVAVTQQNKLSLVPLTRNGGAIQAKEAFTKLLAFSPDQTQQLALQETNGSRSLYILDQTGEERLLLQSSTPIVDCHYEPRRAELLYCLKIDQHQSLGQPVQEPFLSVINLESGNETPLLALPNYQDVRLSVAADGLALLFDQVVIAAPTPTADLFTDAGLAVEGGRLWLLALPELEAKPQNLQPVPPEALMPGYKPQWIP